MVNKPNLKEVLTNDEWVISNVVLHQKKEEYTFSAVNKEGVELFYKEQQKYLDQILKNIENE